MKIKPKIGFFLPVTIQLVSENETLFKTNIVHWILCCGIFYDAYILIKCNFVFFYLTKNLTSLERERK